nr:Epimerase family protein [Candidatus Pantoea persica]
MLCARWEQLTLSAQSECTRVCLLRTGVLLASEGGALSKMKLPFKLGVGGPIGSGKQYLPWIHIDDIVNAMLWLLDHDALSGPFNMVSPYAVRNEQFAATLGHVMHRPFARLHLILKRGVDAARVQILINQVLVGVRRHVDPFRPPVFVGVGLLGGALKQADVFALQRLDGRLDRRAFCRNQARVGGVELIGEGGSIPDVWR